MKILLPVDGSECSEKAVEWAATTFDRATTYYSLLSVLAIVPDLPMVESEVFAVTDMLNGMQAKLERMGCQVAHTEQVLGFPIDRICQYSRDHQMDMIVIGCNGRTGFSKLLLGSVSEGVLEHSDVPVIVYRDAKKSPSTHS